VDSGAEVETAGFPRPQELWDRSFTEENAWRDRFAAIPYADKGGSWQIRFYKDIASPAAGPASCFRPIATTSPIRP
jgi:type I restriction enzyme R subunit